MMMIFLVTFDPLPPVFPCRICMPCLIRQGIEMQDVFRIGERGSPFEPMPMQMPYHMQMPMHMQQQYERIEELWEDVS